MNNMQGNKPTTICNKFVSWWDGEYEGTCELPIDHAGPHYDGSSCFTDELNEVEIKSLPIPEVTASVWYYKSGTPYQSHNILLNSGVHTVTLEPEPGIAIRVEISR